MPVEVRIPRWSDSSDECSLIKWLKAEGDSVSQGEPIAELETDKATVELEAPAPGVLQKALVPDGSSLRVGDLVALLNESELREGAPQVVTKVASPTLHAPAQISTANEPKLPPSRLGAVPQVHSVRSSSAQRSATPLARRMAALAGIDIGAIAAKSGEPRIRKSDVEAALGIARSLLHVAEPESAPISRQFESDEAKQIPITRTRKIIAQRMVESKRTTPHFYLSIDCSLDALLELRQTANHSSGQPPMSITPFLIRAAALALVKEPAINSAWSEQAILAHTRIDIAVAVATERGLVTPVIREAHRKGILSVASELRNLTERAREGRLAPREYEGGTFTISNLGMYGVQSLYAIIDPPQSCILGIGASEERPVVRDHQVSIATMLTATLSADHRVVDGATGAEFLAKFKNLLQDPISLLL
jgi:pyruvate dehydrogenase E2 component (dihydrolipoamide acetyltransferase)